jgi:hypothetical protein
MPYQEEALEEEKGEACEGVTTNPVFGGGIQHDEPSLGAAVDCMKRNAAVAELDKDPVATLGRRPLAQGSAEQALVAQETLHGFMIEALPVDSFKLEMLVRTEAGPAVVSDAGDDEKEEKEEEEEEEQEEQEEQKDGPVGKWLTSYIAFAKEMRPTLNTSLSFGQKALELGRLWKDLRSSLRGRADAEEEEEEEEKEENSEDSSDEDDDDDEAPVNLWNGKRALRPFSDLIRSTKKAVFPACGSMLQAKCDRTPCHNHSLTVVNTAEDAARAYLKHLEKQHPDILEGHDEGVAAGLGVSGDASAANHAYLQPHQHGQPHHAGPTQGKRVVGAQAQGGKNRCGS